MLVTVLCTATAVTMVGMTVTGIMMMAVMVSPPKAWFESSQKFLKLAKRTLTAPGLELETQV